MELRTACRKSKSYSAENTQQPAQKKPKKKAKLTISYMAGNGFMRHIKSLLGKFGKPLGHCHTLTGTFRDGGYTLIKMGTSNTSQPRTQWLLWTVGIGQNSLAHFAHGYPTTPIPLQEQLKISCKKLKD